MLRATFTKCIKTPYRPKPHPSLTRAIRTSIPTRDRYVRFDGPRKNPWDPKRWDASTKLGAVLVLAGGCYYVAHLEQVPQTGRWRFMNTSSLQEAQVSEETRKELRKELANKILPPNHLLSIHVRRVASRILSHSNLGYLRGEAPTPPLLASQLGVDDDNFWTPSDDYGAAAQHSYGPEKEWDVIVVNDDRVINAMATPGLITVFTGILPVCRDEQGLAAVLAHEIGHVVARHTAEKLSAQTVSFALRWLLLAVFNFDWFAVGFLNTYVLELPNSRKQEYEADLIGLRLMSRACYDPTAAPKMFERLNAIESKISGNSIDFFTTHPSSTKRVEQLTSKLPEAYSILAANPECAAIRDQYERFGDRVREIKIASRNEPEIRGLE